MIAFAMLLSLPASALRGRGLFVIQRSKNANTVQYDLRVDRYGKPHADEPLTAYWVLHERGGRREGLSFFERQLAYGWRIVGPVREAGFVFQLQACDRRSIRVTRQAGRYRAQIRIAGKTAYLTKLFVKSTETGLVPKVHYVELFGEDAATGAALRERLVND
jgi:hypothetical protein